MADLDEFSVEQERIARQQEIAKALLSRGASGGLINAYTGQNMMEQSDKDRAALAQRYQAGLAEEVRRIAALRQGREAIEAPADELGGGPGAPAQAGDPRAAVQAAMLSQYAPVRRVGDLEYGHLKKADEPYTLNPGQIRKTPGQPDVTNPNAPLEHESALAKLLREKAKLPPGDPQHETYDNAIRKASETAKQIVNVDASPPITAVTIQDPNDPNGTIVIDGRTRKVLGKGPKLTDAGKMENKRAFNMQGLGGAIQEAEDLLSGITRDAEGNPVAGAKPTSSGIGSLYDTAASFVGVSPAGAAEADKLKVVAGKLTSSVPRMEGPQSDKDVVLYKQMAGDAGNEKLPLDRRLEAVRTLKKLYAKYEHLQSAPGAKPPATRVPAVGAVQNGYRFKGGDPSKPENWVKL
jgi:hypothetical protein